MSVQKLRLQRGWSQEQLADISGLSVRTIQRIERGNAASLESLKALAAAFEIDVSSLKEIDMANSTEPRASTDEVLAFARVRRIRGFYLHAAQFAITLLVLAALSLVFLRDHRWLLFVICGWGGGLALHGLRVFELIPFLNADWEKRTVESYLGRRL